MILWFKNLGMYYGAPTSPKGGPLTDQDKAEADVIIQNKVVTKNRIGNDNVKLTDCELANLSMLTLAEQTKFFKSI